MKRTMRIFSAQMLHSIHGTKAFIFAAIAILWSWALGLTPIAVGVAMMFQGMIWQGLLIIPFLYFAWGLLMGMWPVLALIAFGYGCYASGFSAGLMSLVEWLVFVAVFSAPEWFMTLAHTESVKALTAAESAAAGQ
jgi:hypothetical protein